MAPCSLVFELHVAASSADAFEGISQSQNMRPCFLLAFCPTTVGVSSSEASSRFLANEKAKLTKEIIILPLHIITLLYFSVSEPQEMKQSRSFLRYYMAFFFPSLWPKII